MTRESGDRPCAVKHGAVGCDGEENDMTHPMILTKPAISAFAPVAFVAALGLALLFVAGHAQSAALHDAAHDLRHATGFPCH